MSTTTCLHSTLGCPFRHSMVQKTGSSLPHLHRRPPRTPSSAQTPLPAPLQSPAHRSAQQCSILHQPLRRCSHLPHSLVEPLRMSTGAARLPPSLRSVAAVPAPLPALQPPPLSLHLLPPQRFLRGQLGHRPRPQRYSPCSHRQPMCRSSRCRSPQPRHPHSSSGSSPPSRCHRSNSSSQWRWRRLEVVARG